MSIQAITGIAITCDQPHCTHGVVDCRHDLAAARALTRSRGWTMRGSLDFCPDHSRRTLLGRLLSRSR